MNKAEWLLLLGVIGVLVGPFVTLKLLGTWRKRGKLPPAQPYKDDEDD